MDRKYILAGVRFLIRTDFDFEDSERYVPFRAEFEKPDITYEFVTVEELPEPPSKPFYCDDYISVFINGSATCRYYNVSGSRFRAMMTDEYLPEGRLMVYALKSELRFFRTEMRLFDLLAIEHIMAHHKGMLLHSSFILYNGRAILFTAPSQTGKSTQAELWRRHRGAEVINGDRSLLKLVDGVPHAFSLPYCGTSGICKNRSAPIQAIVVLRQAPFNRITALRPAAAFRDLYEGCAVNIWYKSDVLAACDIIESTIRSVPVLLLECLPDEGAVETLARELGI